MPCAEPNQRHLNKRLCPYIAQVGPYSKAAYDQNGQIRIDAERSNRLIGPVLVGPLQREINTALHQKDTGIRSVMAECREAVSLFVLLHRPVFSFLDNSPCHCWRRGLLCQLASHNSTVSTSRSSPTVRMYSWPILSLDFPGYSSLNKEPSLSVNLSSNP